MSWFERYHVGLGALALLSGLAVTAADRWGPDVLRRRALGVAALVAALLGGWGSSRSWPWWLAAAVLAAVVDDGSDGRQHPLGDWTGALAVIGLVGVWAAVPDTEPALTAAVVLAPLVVVHGVSRRPVGRAGTTALLVALAGSVWVGSAGWGPALAAVCAVGAVAAAPAALGFGRPLVGRAWWALAGAHVVVVLVVPRLIMRWSVPAAWSVSMASLALLGALSATVGPPRRRSSVLRDG